MSPFPVKEYTQDMLAAGYEEMSGPFVAKMPSEQYVVMRMDDYVKYEPPMSEPQRKMVLDDYAAARRGETVDARTALEEIRVKYGF